MRKNTKLIYIKIMKNKIKYNSLAFIIILFSTFVNAADVTIAPPAGGAFVIKSNNGASDRFKVTESGQVYIPSLPATLAGRPLCWDQATGLLQTCTEVAGRDFTPPQITLTAPTIATAYSTSYTIQISDDIELAYYINQDGLNKVIAEGIRNLQINTSASVPLGLGFSSILMAVDTSGNITKKTISILSPETGIKPGNYSTIESYNLPIGFNCLGGNPNGVQDGVVVTGVSISEYILSQPRWSVVDGYRPTISVMSGSAYLAFSGTKESYIPINSTSFTFDRFAGDYFVGSTPHQYKYSTTASVLQTSPPILSISLTMKCNINSTGFIDGTVANFSVSLAP